MDSGAVVAWTLVFGWIGALIAIRKSRPQEVLGRDTFLRVPVRVSSEALPKLVRMRRQKKLKAILRETPIYAELLDEFPEATVEVMRTAPW